MFGTVQLTEKKRQRIKCPFIDLVNAIVAQDTAEAGSAYCAQRLVPLFAPQCLAVCIILLCG